MVVNILIAGDTCPIGKNQRLFEIGDRESLLNDLLPNFQKADLSLINLECPLTIHKSPIQKVGPNLNAPVKCINGIKAMEIDIVGLANNHIMDHGFKGLHTTIQSLVEAGIEYVGAGVDLKTAQMIKICEVKNIRIGIIALAEHEFGIATQNTPGANPIDIIEVSRNIKENRHRFDFLIILLHGGNEYYFYPRPSLMNTCRFLVEQGANAVICQHSHCAGCMETYKGSIIVYGQGNFIFDYDSKEDAWYYGTLICLGLDKNPNYSIKIELIPYQQSKYRPGIFRMDNDDKNKFIEEFENRSKVITDESFVVKEWKKYCLNNKKTYLNLLHGMSGILRRICAKYGFLYKFDSKETQLIRLNIIRCESHRDVLIEILNDLISSNKND